MFAHSIAPSTLVWKIARFVLVTWNPFMLRTLYLSMLLGVPLLASCSDSASSGGTPREVTLTACQDGIDNDDDSWVDCQDQDCQVFAVCVLAPDGGGSDTLDTDGQTDDAISDAPDADEDDDVEHDGSDLSDLNDGTPEDAADDVHDVEFDEDGSAGADTADAVDTDDETTDTAAPPDPCAESDLCLESTFTMTRNEPVLNGIPSSNTFVPLIEVEVQLRFGCDILSSTTGGSYYDMISGVSLAVTCSVTDALVQADATPSLLDYIESELRDSEMEFSFDDGYFWTSARFGGLGIVLTSFEGMSLSWGQFDLAIDGAEGAPELTPFSDQVTSVSISRYVGAEMADFATGPAVLTMVRQPLGD